jgi:hypothetical protein
MVDFGIFMAICLFYGHLVYHVAIWYILWLFGIIFPFWYVYTKKNLATVVATVTKGHHRPLASSSEKIRSEEKWHFVLHSMTTCSQDQLCRALSKRFPTKIVFFSSR